MASVVEDSDSGDEMDYSSDDSWSSFIRDNQEPDSDSDNELSNKLDSTMVSDGGDGGGRGSTTPPDSNGWCVLGQPETNDAADWLLEFNNTNSGCIHNIDTSKFQPVDYFKLFFPTEAIDMIVNETN